MLHLFLNNKNLFLQNFLRRLMLLAAPLLFSFQLSFAQVKFYSSAPKSIPENQNFNLKFTLENAQGSNLKLPSLNDFSILGGPSTSTSMQIINGNVSQSMSYTYVLRPKKQGTFKIGKGTIEVNGTPIESNELTIEVTAPSANQQQQQSRDPWANQNNQQQQQPQTSTADLAKQIKDDVFVKVSLSKSSVYKGEMLTATYKLYFRQNLNGFNLNKSPVLDGFWSKEVELDPNRKQKVENYNGKQFYTIDILKYNLYPQRAGTLQISPAEITTEAQVVLRSQSNDPFDNFFNSGRAQMVPLTLKTEVIKVNVKELPETGKPAGFAGAVGKFNYETSLSNNEAKTDDALTYTIKISGTGNINLIDAPVVKLPDGFEVYDPKVKDKTTSTDAGISGSKQYDYLIIPRIPGDYKINSQIFSFFDPSAEKYITITSPEYDLKITGEPSKNVNSNNAAANSRQDISVLGNDIRYIKTNAPQFDKSANTFTGSVGFYAAYVLPFFLLIGLIAVRRRNETLSADIAGSKRRRAVKLAKKRLSIADKHLAHSDKKKFYDEVSRAMWGYLSDKLNINLAELSKDAVTEKLIAKNVKPETVSRIHELISTCDLSLYSPSGNDSEMKNNYAIALNLIADVEDEIKK